MVVHDFIDIIGIDQSRSRLTLHASALVSYNFETEVRACHACFATFVGPRPIALARSAAALTRAFPCLAGTSAIRRTWSPTTSGTI